METRVSASDELAQAVTGRAEYLQARSSRDKDVTTKLNSGPKADQSLAFCGQGEGAAYSRLALPSKLTTQRCEKTREAPSDHLKGFPSHEENIKSQESVFQSNISDAFPALRLKYKLSEYTCKPHI